MNDLQPLRTFITRFGALLGRVGGEGAILRHGTPLLTELVATDDWLPDAYAATDPMHYRQYLLHRDSAARFSVVSFVWGPGQATPIHDHRVWGLVGVLRGAERVQGFTRDANGALTAHGRVETLEAGQVESFGPETGDIHRVANAFDDRPSVSIHIYGADIGTVERATYALDGTEKRFVSGYANATPPDLWSAAA